MKWSSVKTILLGMLIVMNIFVISALMVRRLSSERIPPVAISAAVDALENSGFSCDAALLPDKYITADIPSVSFYSPVELSRMFFGSQLAFQTSGSALIARSDGAELTVDGEAFVYKTEAEPVEASEERLRKKLRELGISLRGAAYSPEQEIFCCYYGGYPLLEMYLRAKLDAEGEICSIEARWPKLSASGAASSGINIFSHLPRFSEVFKHGGTVKRIRFGYALSKRGGTDIYELRPAWRVVLEDGRSHVFK